MPASDRHYLYPADDLRLTVLNLDQGTVGDRLARVRLAREVLAATAPFPVALRGLGVSSQSVYVQAYDRTGALLALRRRLSRVTGSRPPLALRLLGSVNLLRFRTSEVEPIATAVAALRQLPLGTLEVQTVEIVQTDRVLSRAGTSLLDRVDLRRCPLTVGGRPLGRLSADQQHRARPHSRNERRRPAVGVSEDRNCGDWKPLDLGEAQCRARRRSEPVISSLVTEVVAEASETWLLR